MKSLLKISNLKYFTMMAVIGSVVFATVNTIAIGSICTYCPVGILQVAAAARYINLNMILTILASLLVIIIVGRIFCGYLCTTASIRKVFNVKHKISVSTESSWFKKNSAILVLLLTVLSSLIVGFPLFCLVCPIGLFFGFIFAVLRLTVTYQFGIELILFPFIVFIEILLFKNWCSSICPIGAFMRVVGIVSPKFLKLKTDNNCLTLNSRHCSKCEAICQESILVPKHIDDSSCTLCLDCKDICPQNSIKISSKNSMKNNRP